MAIVRTWVCALCAVALLAACDDAATGGGGGDDDAGVTLDEGTPDPDMATPDPDMGPDPDVGPDAAPGCVPTDELCNGLDDDCDGEIDNGFEGLGDACTAGEGACAADGLVVCSEDGAAALCDAQAGEAGDEICNGIDDDCDGEVDDGLTGAPCETGLDGICAAGVTACEAGEAACVQAAEAGEELCDGLDNDCDGEIDDVAGVGAACEAGIGACLAAGTVVCTPEGPACAAVPGAPGPEVCDGLDNDCNGIDDDVAGVGDDCSAGEGACLAAGTVVCTPEGPACDAVAGEPGPEVCDGLDNDCNGIDDDVAGVGDDCSAGEGACLAAGTVVCTPEGPACDAVPGDSGPEICDGIDNDCNGAIDDLPGLGDACSVGEGACAADGAVVCGPDGPVCNAVPGEPAPETCDGADNNCNGVVDDVPGLGDVCTVGVGICAVDGMLICSPDGPRCDAVPGIPAAEVCDGVDNDCNGVIDDVPGLGDACAVGEGACAANGAVVCGPDGPTCDAVAGEPGPEACDGTDNDCNGVVDDVVGLGDACSVGEGACAANGAVVCGPDGPVCDAVPGEPGPEACDGTDNDCNGVVDDVVGLGDACSVGEGACAANGAVVCGPDGPTCDAVAGEPGPEACDGIDNDCNGVVDDPPVCVPEDCATEGDEDGNGLADCDDAACAGLPVCLDREIVLLCGESDRDISVIFRLEDGIALQAGCAPDAETVAMAVTRNGDIDGPAVAAWLQAGGRLMTEYSGTDEIFNAVFGAGGAQVAVQTGACQDNINPIVRFNEGDVFWQNNGDLPRPPLEEGGCGFDLSAYPEIVPLGGWAADDVSLAYRDLGAGRFWLVEGDWQDNQQGDPFFTAATQRMMRYILIGNYAPVTPIEVPGATVRLVGSIDEADPTWQRGNQNCTSSGGDLHPYETHRIVNRTGAAQLIDVEANFAGGIPGDGYMYVYTEPFDPENFDNCIAGDDDGDQGRGNSQVPNVQIASDQVLVIVISTFYGNSSANNRFIGDYTVDVTTQGM